MKIRTRLFLAFVILVGLGFYKLVDWIIDDLRPRYLESMEESMIDTATILASFVEQRLSVVAPDPEPHKTPDRVRTEEHNEDPPAIDVDPLRTALQTANR